MTPEAQRIAIAEACGWKYGPYDDSPKSGASWFKTSVDGVRTNVLALPEFLSDLNAMHEAEKVLIHPGEQHEYARTLFSVVERDCMHANRYAHIHATAAQRAEAFLKTLNLWTP